MQKTESRYAEIPPHMVLSHSIRQAFTFEKFARLEKKSRQLNRDPDEVILGAVKREWIFIYESKIHHNSYII